MLSQTRQSWLALALYGRVNLQAIAVDFSGCLAAPKSPLHSHVLLMRLNSSYFVPSPVSDLKKHKYCCQENIASTNGSTENKRSNPGTTELGDLKPLNKKESLQLVVKERSNLHYSNRQHHLPGISLQKWLWLLKLQVCVPHTEFSHSQITIKMSSCWINEMGFLCLLIFIFRFIYSSFQF